MGRRLAKIETHYTTLREISTKAQHVIPKLRFSHKWESNIEHSAKSPQMRNMYGKKRYVYVTTGNRASITPKSDICALLHPNLHVEHLLKRTTYTTERQDSTDTTWLRQKKENNHEDRRNSPRHQAAPHTATIVSLKPYKENGMTNYLRHDFQNVKIKREMKNKSANSFKSQRLKDGRRTENRRFGTTQT